MLLLQERIWSELRKGSPDSESRRRRGEEPRGSASSSSGHFFIIPRQLCPASQKCIVVVHHSVFVNLYQLSGSGQGNFFPFFKQFASFLPLDGNDLFVVFLKVFVDRVAFL